MQSAHPPPRRRGSPGRIRQATRRGPGEAPVASPGRRWVVGPSQVGGLQGASQASESMSRNATPEVRPGWFETTCNRGSKASSRESDKMVEALSKQLQHEASPMAHSPLLVVILAAGKGVRMRSELPKVLHAIGGRSMLAHVLAT